MPFFGTVTEALSGKKFHNMGTYKMMQRCALDFFRETRSVTVPRFEFFPKIHG